MSVQSPTQIWAMPAVIGVVSLLGLCAALLADGVWDVVSWLALGIPIGVGLWFSFRSRSQRRVSDQEELGS